MSEIDAIGDHIAADSPENAIAYLDRAFDAILSLSWFPSRHPVAPEAQSFGIEARNLTVGTHRIIYVVLEKRVRVLHIRHTARAAADPEQDDW